MGLLVKRDSSGYGNLPPMCPGFQPRPTFRVARHDTRARNRAAVLPRCTFSLWPAYEQDCAGNGM